MKPGNDGENIIDKPSCFHMFLYSFGLTEAYCTRNIVSFATCVGLIQAQKETEGHSKRRHCPQEIIRQIQCHPMFLNTTPLQLDGR